MIATTRSPFLDLGFRHQAIQTPPRVISEIKKSTPLWPSRDNIRPRISGELLCWIPSEGRWRIKRVSVRCGQIQIGGSGHSGSESSPCLALRRLNLTQGPNAYSFALRRTQDSPPVLTLQASNQHEFDLWVRTIAIELIRQTPLDAIKYLDILTLTPQLHSTPKIENPGKDCNDNSIVETAHIFRPKMLNFDKIDENRNYCHSFVKPIEISQPQKTTIKISNPPENGIKLNSNNLTQINSRKSLNNLSVPLKCPVEKVVESKCLPLPPPPPPKDDEQTVELLLKKCQNSDSYVPVKEKLKLFESLCRLGQIVNSEEVVTNNAKYSSKRTRSLHDLSNSEFSVPANTGVKQICKYFETKNNEEKDTDCLKYNTIARGNRTSFGPVKTIISRKYSVQSKNY